MFISVYVVSILDIVILIKLRHREHSYLDSSVAVVGYASRRYHSSRCQVIKDAYVVKVDSELNYHPLASDAHGSCYVGNHYENTKNSGLRITRHNCQIASPVRYMPRLSKYEINL